MTSPQGSPRHVPEAEREVFRLETTAIRSGTTVIEASAGTGKTYCLTGLVLRLLLEKKVQGIGRVLVVTFTVAATDELVHRIRDALTMACRVFAEECPPPDDFFEHLLQRHRGDGALRILRQARLELDDLMVVTIHGFAKRVLEQNAFESGLPFRQEFLEDATGPLLDAARDFWRQVFYRADPLEAAIAAHRRWTPRTFLDDYDRYTRHPNTTLLPAADLDSVRRQLRRARQQLAESLATPGALHDLGRTLARLQFKKNSRLDPAAVGPLIDALEAFDQRGEVAGLGAVESLALGFLKDQVYKKEHSQIEHLAIPRACQELRLAVEGLEQALRGAFFERVRRLFDHHKERTGQLTFDDLLHRLHRALDDPERRRPLQRAVREQFQVALIDEFQDTDLVQYAIFRRLFAEAPLFLIGDPKQAIYRFRGADVFAYMKARRDAQAVYTLDRNWRSSPPLVDAVNALFSASPRAFVFPEIPFAPVRAARELPTSAADGPPLRWMWLPQMTNRDDAGRLLRRAIADKIGGLLRRGTLPEGADGTPRPVVPADIAILVRTNRQAQELRDSLQQAGIPAVLSRAGNVYDSSEMAELGRLLEAIAEPTHAPRLRAAAATVLWGDDAPTLRALEDDDDAWQERIETMVGYRRRWLRSGFMPMMQQLISERRLKPRLLALHDGERRLTNLLHAVELLHQASHQHHLSPLGLLRWLDAERQRLDGGSGSESESAELRLDSDAAAVQISTIHKSKGLEYGIVFCPYLWESRSLPKQPVLAHVSEDQRVFDFGSDRLAHHHGLAEAERLAEELRLAYVAITRARWRCYVVWGKIGRAKAAATSALAYLLHRPLCGPTLSFDPSPAEWTARVGKDMAASFDRWSDGVAAFAHSHGDLMSFQPIADQGTSAAPPPVEATPEPLVLRRFPDDARRRLLPWSMVSFSSLSRPHGADGGAARPVEGPEHDDPAVAPPAPLEPSGIFAFAKGRQAGHCLHHLLETCDLNTLDDDEATAKVIRTSLRRFGLDAADSHAADIDPVAVLDAMLRRLAVAPVPHHGFTLGDVPRRRWQVEEKFYAPIQGITGGQLASLFAEHGEGSVAQRYAPKLEALQGAQLAGFLTGIIDLVFKHRGRWWLVDWKSNHLGHRVEDYDQTAIGRAMEHHHYILQYHLYVFALHRYLRRRLPDYDYDRHLGGAYYVFLRGLAPEPTVGDGNGEAHGWYYDRPPRALIEALDELVGQGTP